MWRYVEQPSEEKHGKTIFPSGLAPATGGAVCRLAPSKKIYRRSRKSENHWQALDLLTREAEVCKQKLGIHVSAIDGGYNTQTSKILGIPLWGVVCSTYPSYGSRSHITEAVQKTVSMRLPNMHAFTIKRLGEINSTNHVRTTSGLSLYHFIPTKFSNCITQGPSLSQCNKS